MLLSADGLFFSSKTCILISHFLLLPSILSSILIVGYRGGSIQQTESYRSGVLLSTPFARPCLQQGPQQWWISLSLFTSNLQKLCSRRFFSIKSIFGSLWQLSLPHDFTLQQFASEVPCWVFSLFQRGGGNSQIPCFMSSQFPFATTVLKKFVGLQMTPSECPSLMDPLWLLISLQGCSCTVPWRFLSCCWSGVASPGSNCSLVLHSRLIFPSSYCKVPKLRTGGSLTLLPADCAHLLKTFLRSQGSFITHISWRLCMPGPRSSPTVSFTSDTPKSSYF